MSNSPETRPLPDFPGYEIDQDGNVYKSRELLEPNKSGAVTLRVDGVRCQRSVQGLLRDAWPLLVAQREMGLAQARERLLAGGASPSRQPQPQPPVESGPPVAQRKIDRMPTELRSSTAALTAGPPPLAETPSEPVELPPGRLTFKQLNALQRQRSAKIEAPEAPPVG